MKKAIFTALCLGLTALSANVVSLPDMSQEMLTTLMEGKAPGTVVELPQGITLPMYIMVKGDFFSSSQVEAPPYQVTIEKTVFIKIEKGNFLFSSDLKEWKPMETFFTGSFGVSLNIINGTQQVSLFGELKERRDETLNLIYSTD